MDTLTAALIADGTQEIESEEEFYEAYQHLVDTGVAWKLQGTIGRTAMELIKAGKIIPTSKVVGQ